MTSDGRVSYPIAIVRRAREHREHEWTPTEIRRLLLKEFGCTPSLGTIKRWTNPSYNERQKEICTRKNRAAGRAKRDAKMRAMFQRSVGLRAIGQVAAVIWGEELSEEQVRKRLGLRPGELKAARSA